MTAIHERRLAILAELEAHDIERFVAALNMAYALAHGLVEGRLADVLPPRRHSAPVSHILDEHRHGS
jgi:hypothetical protein